MTIVVSIRQTGVVNKNPDEGLKKTMFLAVIITLDNSIEMYLYVV